MITIEPPFKGLNTVKDPKLLGPEWAIEAVNVLINNGIVEQGPKFEPIANPSFTGGPIFKIKQVNRFRSNDLQGQDFSEYIIFTSDGTFAINTETLTHTPISIIAPFPPDIDYLKTVNFDRGLLLFSDKPEKMPLIMFNSIFDDNRIIYVDALYISPPIGPLVDIPIVGVGDADVWPIMTSLSYRVHYVDKFGFEFEHSETPSGSLEDNDILVLPSFPSGQQATAPRILFSDTVSANRIALRGEPVSGDGSGPGDLTSMIRIYRRELVYIDNSLDNGVDDGVWYLIPPETYVLDNSLVGVEDKLAITIIDDSHISIIDRVKPADRDFSTIHVPIAKLESNYNSVEIHNDRRLYLSEKNQLVFTRNDIFNDLEDVITIGDSAKIIDIKSYLGQLVILKENSIYIMSGSPPNVVITRLKDNINGLAEMFEGEDGLYIITKQGILLYNGSVLSGNLAKDIFTSDFIEVLNDMEIAFDYENKNAYFRDINPFGWFTFSYGEFKGWTKGYLFTEVKFFNNKDGELLGFLREGPNLIIMKLTDQGTLDTIFGPIAKWQSPKLIDGALTKFKKWQDMEIDGEFIDSSIKINSQPEIFSPKSTIRISEVKKFLTFTLQNEPSIGTQANLIFRGGVIRDNVIGKRS